jgi:hypothetical protein
LFANELRCRYDDLRRTILSEDYIYSKIDSVAATVQESQNWHYKVWGHMGQATGTGEVQAPSQTYAEEVQRLKDWYQRRLTWLDANMPGTLNGCSMTGLQDLVTLGKINAFPVPFQNNLQVDWSETGLQPEFVRLKDATGRVIQELVIDTDQGSAVLLTDLNELSAGWYIVEIQQGDQVGRLKVIK